MQAGTESFLLDYIWSLRQLHLPKLVLRHVKVFELKYQSLHIVMRTFSLFCQAGSFSICVHTLLMMLSPVHFTTWIWRWLKPWENKSLCCVLTSFPLFHSWRFVLVFCSCLSLFYSIILHSQADSLICTTAVIWGWNRYWNKSQHRKLILEKKILLPLLPGLEARTFQSQVQHSNHWAIPVPLLL